MSAWLVLCESLASTEGAGKGELVSGHCHFDGSQRKLRTLGNGAGFGSADSSPLAAKLLEETVLKCGAFLRVCQEFVILSLERTA